MYNVQGTRVFSSKYLGKILFVCKALSPIRVPSSVALPLDALRPRPGAKKELDPFPIPGIDVVRVPRPCAVCPTQTGITAGLL